MVQLEAAATVVPQALVPVEMAKSAGLVPTMLMPMILSGALPVLGRGADSPVAVELTAVLGKGSVAGVRLATGAVTATPVPLTGIDWVTLEPLRLLSVRTTSSHR